MGYISPLRLMPPWRDRAGHVWHQLRAAVEEMNYAARRLVELQMRLPR